MSLLGRRVSKEKQGEESRRQEGEGVDRESLLLERTQSTPLPVHPRMWVVLGGIFVVLGLTQLALAATWVWWLGMAFGFGIAKTGASLVGIGLTGGQQAPLPQGASAWQCCSHAVVSAVTWGSSKTQRLFWALRWPLYLYGTFVLLLITIHVASPDPRVEAFPAKCARLKWLGCSRVAAEGPHMARGLAPLRLAAPLKEAQAAVVAWVGEQAGARVLRSTPGFVHARFVTRVFGFADDFFVGLRCDGEGQTVVEAQGQLRIGHSDLGVNARRNQRFVAAMQAATLPPGACAVR